MAFGFGFGLGFGLGVRGRVVYLLDVGGHGVRDGSEARVAGPRVRVRARARDRVGDRVRVRVRVRGKCSRTTR